MFNNQMIHFERYIQYLFIDINFHLGPPPSRTSFQRLLDVEAVPGGMN